ANRAPQVTRSTGTVVPATHRVPGVPPWGRRGRNSDNGRTLGERKGCCGVGYWAEMAGDGALGAGRCPHPTVGWMPPPTRGGYPLAGGGQSPEEGSRRSLG